MPHILVICTANICRSPVAEVLLRDRLGKREMDGWTVSSAGTWALLERGAARYSVELMAEQGFDLTGHRAIMVGRGHLEAADLVLCMASGHAEALRAEFPEYATKVHLISEMVGMNYSIKDPYGGPMEMYREMVAELTGLIESGLDRIIELALETAGSDEE